MLTYDLSKRNKPLYYALYLAIRADILSGKLSENEKLPSRRELAAHLNVSEVTVNNAYLQLYAEGYIRSETRKGWFVCEVERQPTAKLPLPEKCRPLPEKRKDLSLGSNAALFPFSTWSKVTRKVLADEYDKLLYAAPNCGIAPLREAIAEHLARFRGMEVNSERIVIGSGAEYLYGLLVQLLGTDCLYALEDPSYPKIGKVYAAHNARCAYVRTDKEGIVLSELPPRTGVLHLSPLHSFPLGVVTSAARRKAALQWASEKPDRYIVEDDYDSEFRLEGKPLRTMFSADTNGCVVYMNTFSQTVAPSMRIGYMILPDGLYEKFEQTLGFYSCTVPVLDQFVLARFISEGYFERHLSRLKKAYRQSRIDAVKNLQTLQTGIPLQTESEDAAPYLIVRAETDMSDEELKNYLAERGFTARVLSEYYHTPNPPEHLLLLHYFALSGTH